VNCRFDDVNCCFDDVICGGDVIGGDDVNCRDCRGS
jgi:hypothetical protein